MSTWRLKLGMARRTSLSMVAAASMAIGCTTTVVGSRLDSERSLRSAESISDNDVLTAYRARPHLPARVRVAFHAYDDQHAAEIAAMLAKVPTVSTVFRLPAFVVSGRGRFESVKNTHPAPNIRRLRLMAARARADVVMVFDYGDRISRKANGLAAFGVAILPLLFLPFQDVDARSYLDGFVVDTRNGYFYGHVSAARDSTTDFVTIYSDAGKDLVAQQRAQMLSQLGEDIDQLFREQRVASGTAKQRGAIGGGTSVDLDTEDPWATTPRRLLVVMSAAGVTLDGEPVTSPEDLAERVRVIARRRHVVAEIRSTAGVAVGRVQQTAAILENAGVRKLRFAVEPEPAPDPEGAPQPEGAPKIELVPQFKKAPAPGDPSPPKKP